MQSKDKEAKKRYGAKFYLTIEDIERAKHNLKAHNKFTFGCYRGINARHKDTTNWLMKWKMEERGLSVHDLAMKAGVSDHTIRMFLRQRPSDLINPLTERICRVMCIEPQEIGYGLKFLTIKSPYRVDVTALYKILDVMAAGVHQCYTDLRRLSDEVKLVASEVMREDTPD